VRADAPPRKLAEGRRRADRRAVVAGHDRSHPSMCAWRWRRWLSCCVISGATLPEAGRPSRRHPGLPTTPPPQHHRLRG